MEQELKQIEVFRWPNTCSFLIGNWKTNGAGRSDIIFFLASLLTTGAVSVPEGLARLGSSSEGFLSR